MSYHDELLALARAMVLSPKQPTDAAVRRTVSTAYYALFHRITLAGAERFVGAAGKMSAGYRLIYRSFNHGRLKEVCRALDVPSLSPATKRHLNRTTVSVSMRTVAANFIDLQDLRHLADYEPDTNFTLFDAEGCIKVAQVAIDAFDGIPESEQADVLALMLVNPRDR